MKISANVLRRFCAGVPQEAKALRRLLDDLGIEVKRMDVQGADALLTLELLANRGDHHCYAGVAREIAARTKTPLSLPTARSLQVGAPPLPLRVESEKCLLYTATPLRVTGGLKKSLGKPAEELLGAAGLLTGNAAIDVTNLVNLEIGQPSHAFDRARIQGGIIIRLSRPGEKAWLLFTPEPRELPSGTLVIADDVKVLAIAGVIGCEDSKISDDTKEIIFESAAFDPVTVRLGGRSLQTFTDASARFERGSDVTLATVAAGRIAQLLADAGVAEVTGPTGVAGDWKDPELVLPLRASELSAFLGRNFAEPEIVERLTAYGFEHRGNLSFKVPPHRLWDIESEEDLFEEIARSVGLNELPESLPPVAMGARPSREQVMLGVAEDILVSAGFYEVYTDGFYSRAIPERLGQSEGSPLFAHVETVNSLDNSFSLLKNNCLAQAVQAVADNINVKAQDVRLYEWTRSFHPDSKAENGVCRERDVLYAICSGKERPESWDGGSRAADVFFLKGMVEELTKSLDLPLELGDPDPAYALTSLLHPHRCLSLRVGGQSVGVIGEVLPQILQAFGVKFAKACYFEISRDALLVEPRGSAAFVMPPEVPDIDRMLSFAAPLGVSVREIVPLLKAAAPPWLSRISVADVFAGAGEGQKRAVAFKLFFSAAESRTHEQLNDACSAMVKSVVDTLGSRGVEQR
ncbi:MAG TPA: phenylalanine--tRNA ligase subunit beta [Polyangiaceae bacterium]|nr:phenylalanine--tRNA ligase subunit beta [Polyangiaceae bacterium]